MRRWLHPRARMVASQLRGRGIRSRAVLAAMGSVPRERFVDDTAARSAYDDRALGIANGQTISQPYIVARMTELLGLDRPGSDPTRHPPRVLDVGTGSGYQAAILAAMGVEVVSVERDPALADAARQRLARLGYQVEVVVGDGSEGLPERAPYDGIIVAAAAPVVPPPLLEQLAPGGRLVVPVGDRERQRLTLVERLPDDEYLRTDGEPCVFVPLIGRYGFPAV
ncbi:MAG: protein-L-isoaspartate(D-aspartate) O-methyltransferase [Candidatus Limnocylindrales bacterium]